jgi:hypothetical protein
LLLRGLAEHGPQQQEKLLNASPDIEVRWGIAPKSEDTSIGLHSRNKTWELDSHGIPGSAYSPETIIVARTAPAQASLATSIRQYYRQQFQTADRQLLGHITKKDLPIGMAMANSLKPSCSIASIFIFCRSVPIWK